MAPPIRTRILRAALVCLLTALLCTAGLAPALAPRPTAAASAVNTFTGTYEYSFTDFQIAGSSPALRFERSYVSGYVVDTHHPELWPLGDGWTHSYNMRVTSRGDGSPDLYVWGPQGRVDHYTPRPDGSFAPPLGVDATLERRPDGTLVVTHPGGLTWVFDHGRLIRVAGASGMGSDLAYNAQGQLVSVTDPDGRGALALSYDAGGRLVAVGDWLQPPRTLRFGYDALGRLETVTNRADHITTYRYEGAEPGRRHLLTEIVDARGHTAITITYDAERHAVNRRDARGLTSGLATLLTFDTQPDGRRRTTHSYPPSAFEPGWSPVIEDTYDAQGRLVERVDRPTSGETYVRRYRYDSVGGLAAVTSGDGRTMPRIAPRFHTYQSCQLDAVLADDAPERAGAVSTVAAALLLSTPPQPAAATGAAALAAAFGSLGGQLTRRLGSAPFEFDPVGRPIALHLDAAALGTGDLPPLGVASPVAQRFEYDAEDRLIRVTDELRDAPPRSTEYRYDPVGNLTAVASSDGRVTEFEYDERDAPVSSRWGQPGQVDADGNTSRDGSLRYAYDERGDVLEAIREGTGAVLVRLTYAHDGAHRLRLVTLQLSAEGAAAAHVPPETVGAPITIRFDYDRDGNCTGYAFD